MGTTADGMVPDLMAGDFRHGREGRAKTADFLGQLFRRDPARARSLRAKARGMMEADEKSLLDRLILQARKAEEEPGEEPARDPGVPFRARDLSALSGRRRSARFGALFRRNRG